MAQDRDKCQAAVNRAMVPYSVLDEEEAVFKNDSPSQIGAIFPPV